MNSLTGGSLGPKTETPRDCLIQLNVLVPKTLDVFSKLTDPERDSLAVKVTEVLGQVLKNPHSFEGEQKNNLMNIRELAKKAENMGLLSEKPSKDVMSKIAAATREKGLSLYTAPRDLTIKTRDGVEIKVNSDILKENSPVFTGMYESGMKEKKENILDLKNYSDKTVELLISSLHAPSTSAIELPHDDSVVLELMDFAMTYELDGFIQKLEPAVSRFIAEQPQTVLKNTEAWMSFLLNQKEGKYSTTATKLIADLTPHFLDNFDIPVKLSDVPGKFEIPIEHVDYFFNKDTGGLLQHLPVVLEIKNEEDLAIFEEACKVFKTEEKFPIKLLCRQGLSVEEEAHIHQIASASNVEIILEKLSIPPGTVFFGKEEWETHFGTIEKAPPIPAGIAEILKAQCPYFPGQTYKDTFMLVLVPATVNGKPLHLNHLRELVQNPKGGHSTNYNDVFQPILDEHGNTALHSSYWALMSMKELPNSRDKTYFEQQAHVAANPSYEVPDLLSAAVCTLTHFVRTGVRLFSREPKTYTRCQETSLGLGQGRYQTVVGGFGAHGLEINRIYRFGSRDVGVAALRKFI